MEKKKGKGIEAVNLLPEPIIQHIQSFLNGKDAAQTALLSRPWYNAWLTRPSLDFDLDNFINRAPKPSDFDEFTAKTMQRYQDLNLNIQSFRLCTSSREYNINLILNAIKICATDLELILPSFNFPQEVLESESIIRLSLGRGEIGRDFVPRWPRLKSLSINRVLMTSGDAVKNIISSCCASIEELSLLINRCNSVSFSQMCPYELHKLKCLFLDSVLVDNTFFKEFATRFPCLKELSLVKCSGYTSIEMASTSLECIRLVQPPEKREMDKFDVPNIRKFTYSAGGHVPSLSINKGRSSTREWEFEISIKCYGFPDASWFLSMRKLLKKMRLSTIKIFLSYFSRSKIDHDEVNNNFGVVPKRVAVESLTIQAPSKFCSATLLHLIGICCPKFITHYWLPESSTSYAGFPRSAWKDNNESLGVLCNVLSANQDSLGLNEVKVEISEKIHKDDQWRPLVLKGPLDASKTPVNRSKVRFQLRWG